MYLYIIVYIVYVALFSYLLICLYRFIKNRLIEISDYRKKKLEIMSDIADYLEFFAEVVGDDE